MSDLISILRERAIFTGDKFHGRVADKIEQLERDIRQLQQLVAEQEDIIRDLDDDLAEMDYNGEQY